ncbi:PilZ domain-containing protein [Sphingomonas ginkgonis]|nr:PilZ domain-containing protein [Sphingomonas ginkgonis]
MQVETTLYSLSESAPPVPRDRRDGERHMTLFRVGSMLVEGRRELCLIKNISAGGMMVRAYCDLPVGTRLTIELKSGQPIVGEVGWVRESQMGLKFDRPIDVIEMLSNSSEGPRPRMPRVEITAYAMVREGASTYRMRVHDISQGGVKVEGTDTLGRDAEVVVTLGTLPPQPGTVRWRDGRFTGITFNRLLPLPVLVSWLQEQQNRSRAA